MTFLNANIFFRALVEPTTPQSVAMTEQAKALFREIDRGEQDATTSEAVIAEVACVLSSRRQYGMAPEEVAARLRPLLTLSHLQLPRGRRRLYLRALDLWMTFPKLGVVDALTAATVEDTDVMLATFDRDFDALPGLARWSPSGHQ